MKHTRILPLTLAILFALMFAGCDRSTDYRSDVDIEVIAETLTPMLNHPETLVRYDADHIHFFLGLPEPYCRDSVVMVQTRAGSADEYGVFLCASDEDAEALEELLDDYLELTIPGKLAYLGDCDPTETPASDPTDSPADRTAHSLGTSLTGRVKRYGNYVCYTLLDDEADDALQDALKRLLRQ